MEYKGAWNASTNTPTLANGVGNNGDFYRVSVAGTRNLGAGSVDYDVGDTLVYNATTAHWDHFDDDDAPTSAEILSALGYTPERIHPQITDLGNVSGAVSIDLAASRNYRMTLVGNVTLSWTNVPAAGLIAEPLIEFVQDGTGGRTVTWPASTKWPNGVIHVVSAAAGDEDHVSFRVKNGGSSTGYPVEDIG
jgi:hypothetical protein